ncbi:hypothetical protein M426DRAFT_263535 [Hypoxylon sp. CI-4A]|nr:hypothetical protein M426DRAFT_263535 [Hypoxylon sp. CI-4A]
MVTEKVYYVLAEGSETREGHAWMAPGPNDFRGPCPMLNTLANHGFLPHDGDSLTKEVTINALTAALNFDSTLGTALFQIGIVANPEPNATSFNLDQLNVHNVLEHDASMSRSDAFFGNNHVFNESIFEETKAYWTGPTLDANMLANGKIARQVNSKAFNPDYTFTSATELRSLGEVSGPIIAFGDIQAATVDRSLVEYFFENERFPTELGWQRQSEVVTVDDFLRLGQVISNATSLITSEKIDPSQRRDLH